MDSIEGLNGCRAQLNELDKKIIDLFAERDDVACNVAAFKEQLGRPSYDEVQEEAMINSRRVMAEAMGLDPDYIEEIFRRVHDHSVEVQEAFRTELNTIATDA